MSKEAGKKFKMIKTSDYFALGQAIPRSAAALISLALVLLVLWSANLAYGQAAVQNHATASLRANVKEIVPGKPFILIVDIKMQPGWHTYYKDPGDAGMPTRINWQLPKKFRASVIDWPKPEKFNDSGIITYGYENSTELKTTIYPAANLSARVSKKVTIKADVKWLVCKDLCVPGEATLSIMLPVANNKTALKESFATAGDTAKITQPISVGSQTISQDNKTPSQEGFATAAGTDSKAQPISVDSQTVSQDTQWAKKKANQADNIASAISSGAKGPTGRAFVSILDRNIHESGLSTKKTSLPIYLLLAFVGGFILNFMPCVLPVISIKLVSFMEEAGSDPKHVFVLGMIFSLGILVSFMSLAALVIVLKSLGHNVGWGFQFQHPLFLLAMAALVLAFALSLFGLFHIQAPGSQEGLTKLAGHEGLVGTFFKGVLATILSTPCTAPFLGTAVGFAFSQNAATICLVFFTVGLGLASPYMVLTANPKLMPHLPKPGAWMEKLKEFMGFMLLATVLWLVWVLGQQAGQAAMIFTLCFLLSISFALWIIGRLVDLTTPPAKKYCLWGLAAVFVGISYYYLIANQEGLGQPATTETAVSTAKQSTSTGLDWQPFSVAALDRQLSAHKTVFLDFTADWCLNCKANEKAVLDSADVVAKLKDLNVVTMKADWTKQNPTITKLLKKFGRSGVPLYVIFPADKEDEPIVLPEIVTPSIVLNGLDKAGKSKS